MTKEELKQEARKDVDSLNGIDLVSSTMIAIDKYGAYKLGRYDGYLASAEPREKRIAELEKENAELKKEWQEQVQKATDEGYARTLQTMQLTKAKELLAKWVELFKPKGGNIPPTPIQVETEQFLNSEVEK